ncbi:B-cell antigen receptor complex-associated protein alpha chain-like isoform X2 [Heptranchias perlo]|uniref:B-cell antigen receptor complex-associated protein alpha chain-like isoform X2 n=1 Tax=Heptranchias perlo TaxID=212740 RepID=UPI003559DD31
MANGVEPAFQTLAVTLLVMEMLVHVGTVKVPEPSVRAEIGKPFQLPCRLEPGEGVVWEKRSYNNSTWRPLNSTGGQLTLQKVEVSDVGIYRCRNARTNDISCDIGVRVYSKQYPKLFDIEDSMKNIILMVEGILLIVCVMIPGTILLREKSQKSLREKIQRYKEENENLYEGLNQADQSTYEDITRGQQCMYEDVANCRLSDSQLEQP